jgi:uncharacterized protein YbjT (DUF2867 family)
MRTFVIIGGTGHTGKPIALGLLEKGHKVRIVSRDADKAKELIDKGAEHFSGSSQDTAFLKKAFEGADALYAMIPYNYSAGDFTAFQESHAKAIAEALKGSTIKYVVTLSSVGAHLASGGGVVQGLHSMEQLFNTLDGINVLHLRPTYFLENALGMIGMIKMMGILGTPMKGDLKLPMVATKDIAAVGLKHLLALDFSGKSHEYILGARDYSYNEIVKIYGKAIGKPDLNYVQFPYEDAKAGMMQMGMGESASGKMIEFVKSVNEGRVQEDFKRTPGNTTPTTAEEFAHVFKMAYENS